MQDPNMGAHVPEEVVDQLARGEGSPHWRRHINSCATCAEEVAIHADLVRVATRLLPPRGCPDSETLLSFSLGVLSAEECVRVASHCGECPRCQAYLRALTTPEESMPVPPVPAPYSWAEGWRDVLVGGLRALGAPVLQLIECASPEPVGAYRSGRPLHSEQRRVLGGGYTLDLFSSRSPGGGAWSLRGVLELELEGDPAPGGTAVTLLATNQRLEVPFDSLDGSFEVSGVEPGRWLLLVELPGNSGRFWTELDLPHGGANSGATP